MTRNRGVPLDASSAVSVSQPTRIWLPDQLHATYYSQRATPGGLVISESIHPSASSGAMPGVPGLWLREHIAGWRQVTDAVHARGGVMYAQLTHHGRAAIPQFAGHVPLSSSATPWSSEEKYPYPPPDTPKGTPYMESLVQFRDYPPREMAVEDIRRTVRDYVDAARMAVEAGFDGVEIHGGNGYLVDQFLSSNVNRRVDEYGGGVAGRCRFVLELIESVGAEIGLANLAVRLSPFGVYNDVADADRWETYTYLLREIKDRFGGISYVHFVEARSDDMEKSVQLKESWPKDKTMDLAFVREILTPVPILSAGGWDAESCWGVVEKGKTVDACVFARWFVSNPDLVERLRHGRSLTMYNRGKFYGPTSKREVGYTDYKAWGEETADVKGGS
jgi:2,4-dienoyl-CoA reductase-like NADH-dependent reductase (Old Yellow Enzyme family)